MRAVTGFPHQLLSQNARSEPLQRHHRALHSISLPSAKPNHGLCYAFCRSGKCKRVTLAPKIRLLSLWEEEYPFIVPLIQAHGDPTSARNAVDKSQDHIVRHQSLCKSQRRHRHKKRVADGMHICFKARSVALQCESTCISIAAALRAFLKNLCNSKSFFCLLHFSVCAPAAAQLGEEAAIAHCNTRFRARLFKLGSFWQNPPKESNGVCSHAGSSRGTEISARQWRGWGAASSWGQAGTHREVQPEVGIDAFFRCF